MPRDDKREFEHDIAPPRVDNRAPDDDLTSAHWHLFAPDVDEEDDDRRARIFSLLLPIRFPMPGR